MGVVDLSRPDRVGGDASVVVVDQEGVGGVRLVCAAGIARGGGSVWVNREVEHWVGSKSPDRILPVVTDGQWHWDPERGDFTPDSTAVPVALRGVSAEEPFFLDLRWARDDGHLTLRHSRFRDAIAQLAAPMHGISKDDLEGEDVRLHRRTLRWRWAVATFLVSAAMTVVASVTYVVVGGRNADRANAAAAESYREQAKALEQQWNAQRCRESNAGAASVLPAVAAALLQPAFLSPSERQHSGNG